MNNPVPALFEFKAIGDVRNPFTPLLRDSVPDPAAWEKAHRQFETVHQAEWALHDAMLKLGWSATRQMLLMLTLPANRLFCWLEDGLDFDERTKTVAFASETSCDVFQSRFPDWEVEVR